ncbi:hypothetical protein TWF696_000311 [Orbilia brochopaga]|uniref:Transmembrane protein n=1 Tax=Orbilia brochopaga TaxID=3140254 RepID=A0AAV9VDN9_9PEZI
MKISKGSNKWLRRTLALGFVVGLDASVLCHALSGKFYENYVEAESLLRGGTGLHDLQAVQKLQSQLTTSSTSSTSYMTPQTTISSLASIVPPTATAPSILLTESILGPGPTMSTHDLVSALTNPVNVSPLLQLMSALKQTESDTSGMIEEHTETSLDASITPLPAQDSLAVIKRPQRFSRPPPPPNIRYVAGFWQEIVADSTSASIQMRFGYDPYYSTIQCYSTKAASIGTWNISQTLFTSTSSMSPVPSQSEDIYHVVRSGFREAVAQVTALCDVFGRDANNQIEALYTSAVDGGVINGGLDASLVFLGATARWVANWGPYDVDSPGYNLTFTYNGVQNDATASATETWRVQNPYFQARGSDRRPGLGDISSVALYIPFETTTEEFAKRTIVRRERPRYYPTATASITSIPLYTRGMARTKVAVTKTVAATTTLTETAKAPDVHARGQKPGRTSKLQTLFTLLPWVFAFWVLVLICTIALAWERISKYIYKFKIGKRHQNDNEAADIDSSALNILPTVRKSSGSQIADPSKLEASRNRTSKESLRTVTL